MVNGLSPSMICRQHRLLGGINAGKLAVGSVLLNLNVLSRATAAPRRGISSMTATEFMSTVKKMKCSDYQIADVRELSEVGLVSLGNGLNPVILPISEFESWRSDINNKLDIEKTIFCIVGNCL